MSRVDFIAVPSRDRARTEQFYTETLRLAKNPNSTETWIEFEASNVTLAIVVPEEVGLPFETLPFGTIALRVPDVDETRGRLEAEGVPFERETIDSGVCRMAFFRDPDGNGLLIHHRYAPYRDGRSPDEQS